MTSVTVDVTVGSEGLRTRRIMSAPADALVGGECQLPGFAGLEG